MNHVLIYGATSAIAEATAREFAQKGAAFYLVARDSKKLEMIAADLRTRGAPQVRTATADLAETANQAALFARILGEFPALDTVLIAHGTLGDQKASETDFGVARRELETNFISVVAILTPIANHFEQKRGGVIAVISSVAGDRGRQSNYVYGCAKGAVSLFLQGLRNRLFRSGVSVLTVKPGFVDTPMTAHIPKNPLFASSTQIARSIVRGIERRKDVIYAPGFWWVIMAIIKCIPEGIFKKLKL